MSGSRKIIPCILSLLGLVVFLFFHESNVPVLVVAVAVAFSATTITVTSSHSLTVLPSFITTTRTTAVTSRTVHSYRNHNHRGRCRRLSKLSSTKSSVTGTLIGTDPTTKPNYDRMTGPFGKWVDDFCLTLFRNQLREEVLRSYRDVADHPLRADPAYYGNANYSQIVALAAAMNARNQPSNPQTIQQSAQNVLISMFPSWLPRWYQILFAKPFPVLSARMNAFVTAALGVWLMGECTVNDILLVRNTTMSSSSSSLSLIGKNQGVLVTRCRFLEESQCASICIHSCKIPTQNFFQQQMGVPLLMEPNYTTGSCQFSFGRYPNTTTETSLIQTPCLTRCPTAGSYRQTHRGDNPTNKNTVQNPSPSEAAICSMIEDI